MVVSPEKSWPPKLTVASYMLIIDLQLPKHLLLQGWPNPHYFLEKVFEFPYQVGLIWLLILLKNKFTLILVKCKCDTFGMWLRKLKSPVEHMFANDKTHQNTKATCVVRNYPLHLPLNESEPEC